MRRIVLFFGIILVIALGYSGSVQALLSQTIMPDEVWLTVYQNIDRAWAVEKVALLLNHGENRFFLSGQNLLRERFYLHPFDPSTSLKTISTTDFSGYLMVLESQKAGSFPFLISFFVSGFDWRERYQGVWDEKEQLFYLYPSVFLSNQHNFTWKNLHLSWLLGKPTFHFEGDKGGMMTEEAPLASDRVQSQIAVEKVKPMIMERVSEYQVFHLPYVIDLPGPSVLQVFPGLRKFPVKELIRIEEGSINRILKMKSEGDPLPQGLITIFGTENSVVGTFEFPLVRSQEEFEIPIGSIRTLQVDRIESGYLRKKVDFNEDRDIAGFWSEKVIQFDIKNWGETDKQLDFIELLPPGAKITGGGEQWQWENGRAHLKMTINPGKKETILLNYEFREEWS